MDIFIDTADVGEIREALALGVLDGVTTNPTLVARSGRPYRALLDEICELVRGPVSAEVLGHGVEDMLSEAHELAAIAPNIVVKLPITPDGLRVTKRLTDEGIATNLTLCFSPLQAVLAAKAGATYVSPFVGRLDDIGHEGMELVEKIVEAYDNYEIDTRVLVASVRSPTHVLEALRIGADAATLPFAVIEKLIAHPLTDRGLLAFDADAAKIRG
jgi:transaldolase